MPEEDVDNIGKYEDSTVDFVNSRQQGRPWSSISSSNPQSLDVFQGKNLAGYQFGALAKKQHKPYSSSVFF